MNLSSNLLGFLSDFAYWTRIRCSCGVHNYFEYLFFYLELWSKERPSFYPARLERLLMERAADSVQCLSACQLFRNPRRRRPLLQNAHSVRWDRLRLCLAPQRTAAPALQKNPELKRAVNLVVIVLVPTSRAAVGANSLRVRVRSSHLKKVQLCRFQSRHFSGDKQGTYSVVIAFE